jgi:hypothetical protein
MKYNYKSNKVGGVEYKYFSEWIYDLGSEEHWRLYWNQQNLMQNKIKRRDNVFDLGVGGGFTAKYYKARQVNIKTFDIDRKKKSRCCRKSCRIPMSRLLRSHIGTRSI